MASNGNGAFHDNQMIGQYRTFGNFGPAYRVLAPLRTTPDGKWILQIKVLTSGEEAEYPYEKALEDPIAN